MVLGQASQDDMWSPLTICHQLGVLIRGVALNHPPMCCIHVTAGVREDGKRAIRVLLLMWGPSVEEASLSLIGILPE